MNENKTRYPLCWPDGWPRTPRQNVTHSRFKRPGFSSGDRNRSMAEATEFLSGELQRLGAQKVILSTNIELRLDGVPYSGRATPADTGVAVYFELKGKPSVLACDKWNLVQDNIWAIAKHIESLRGQARWGVGSVEQAFRGYAAIPERTSGSSWWEVLGVPINAAADQVKEAYRLLALKHHPDRGGDKEMFYRVQEAYDQAMHLHREEKEKGIKCTP